VVENPRAAVAVPDFVSQPSASGKSLNVAKEIPIEPQAKVIFFYLCDPQSHSNALFFSMRSLLSGMQTQTLNTKTSLKSVNNMLKNKPPQSKPLILLKTYMFAPKKKLHSLNPPLAVIITDFLAKPKSKKLKLKSENFKDEETTATMKTKPQKRRPKNLI